MQDLASIESLPSVPGAHKLLGHHRELRRDQVLSFLDRVATKVDRVSRLRVIGPHALLVNHPESIHALLVDRARQFEKSLMIRFALYPLAGEGLFTSRGELWRRQRKILAPMFHPPRIVGFGPDMIACADRVVDEWGEGEDRTLFRETTRITMSVAGKTLFHADTFDEADEIGHALTTALEFAANNAPSFLSIAHLFTSRAFREASRYVPSLAATAERFEQPVFVPGEEGRQVRRAIAFLDDYVAGMIAERRADPGRYDDLLARLLQARDEDGAAMSDKQVRDEVLTLFVAGHETTATALAWAIYLLCRHPSIYAAAQAEADAIGNAPTVEDLPRLPLMLRIFKEALRLYPPVYFDGRQTMGAADLCGVKCPPWTIATFSPYTLHRRPDLWPDPLRFDPDRFLPEAEARRSRYAWIPFGVGPRVCIGMGFAVMEGQLVLARLLQRARFELLGDDVPHASATLRPREGIRVRVRLRSRASA